MLAIYKREMRAYFTSFIGYTFIATFLVIAGLLFSLTTLSQGAAADVTLYFKLLMFVYIVIIPLLTMKLFSDEKRLHTDTLLLTSPVGLFGMVFAKFLAAFTMYALTLLVSCINLIPLYRYGNQNTVVIFGNLFALLLIGAAFIAIGVFLSSLTENQIVAAISTIAALLFLLIVGTFSDAIGFAPLRYVLNFLSIFKRFTFFTYGLIDYAALIYYASVVVVFLFLTVRVFEKRRWS